MLGSEARRADGGDRVFCGVEGGGSRRKKIFLWGGQGGSWNSMNLGNQKSG